nr:unnamed protein product [Callosobruchus chinensis]
MVPYFGKHGCKQLIRGKPIRWGYELWVGALTLGYVIWFSAYQGASSDAVNNIYKNNYGLGTSVILQYTDILRSKWNHAQFHLYFDNFSTSIYLLDELKKRDFNATGTIRENRILNCPLTNSPVMKKAERGSFEYQLDKDTGIVVCRWHHNSVVTVSFNFNQVFSVNSVKRYSQKEKT